MPKYKLSPIARAAEKTRRELITVFRSVPNHCMRHSVPNQVHS